MKIVTNEKTNAKDKAQKIKNEKIVLPFFQVKWQNAKNGFIVLAYSTNKNPVILYTHKAVILLNVAFVLNFKREK